MRPKFRFYFQHIVDMILNQKESIKSFIEKCGVKNTKKKTLRQKNGYKNKTRRVY